MKTVQKNLGGAFARLLIVTSLAAAFPAHANDQSEIERLKALIQELDQRVRVLDRKQELAAEEVVAKQKTAPVVNAGESGFGFKSADGQFEYKLRGLTQIDYRNFSGTGFPSAVDGFLARRIRPTFEGTVFGKYGFRFTPEFGESGDGKSNTAPEQNKARVIDAYLDIKEIPEAQIRFGKFKPFVGLERLQGGGDTKFIERSYVSNNILPNRDFGVSVFGDVLSNKLNYAFGVFNGVTDGADNSTAQDLNNGKEYTARLFATPFIGTDSALQGLGFGISGTSGSSIGTSSITNLPSYKTPGQANTFFNYNSNVLAYGNKTQWSPQAYLYKGPFGLLTEYAEVSQGLKNTLVGGGTKLTAENNAWHVTGSWLLTGEDASFKSVKPNSPFKNGVEGAWGAWELVARYQENNLDKNLFSGTSWVSSSSGKDNAQAAKTIGIGLNWYVNSSSRFAVNYDRTNFTGGKASGSAKTLDGKSEDLLVARYQLSF